MLNIPPPPAVSSKPVRKCDVECYRNYFLVKFYDAALKLFYKIEMFDGRPFNAVALRMLLSDATIVTFNGYKYDLLMISAAATGRFTNDMLKNLSDFIFANRNSQPWMIAREWGFELLDFDHIDLIEVAPGIASLKAYGARLHSKKLQDLPYDPAALLTYEEMVETEKYCGNDLIVTDELHVKLAPDIEIREELSTQYGVDLRSKSDAQIAEAAFKALIPYAIQKRVIAPGYRFQYQPAPWLHFQTPEMQDAFRRCTQAWFVVPESGKPPLPPELDDYAVHFAGAVYRMGNGGLHSSEEKVTHRAGPDVELADVDFDSFYPMIIRLLGMYPEQIGPQFCAIFNGWIDTRLGYKRSGQKKRAGTFKIKINGTFGKLGSKYSILYAPELMIRTTITGQLTLLMFIERMVLAGLQVVQANTDGIVVKCHPSQAATRDAIVRDMERITGMTTETNKYVALFSRDVNNYLAAKANNDGTIEFKTKGAYADEGLAKNPTAPICVTAVKEFLHRGTPLEQTIRRCDDIRQFVTVRGVKGGGDWVEETINADRVAEKRAALIAHGWNCDPKGQAWYRPDGFSAPRTTDQALRTLRAEIPRKYLGKTVRWYYGEGQRGHISTSDGKLVAKSEGAKPCMDLPDVLPPDIDYGWYVQEASSMLHDLGVM